MLRSLRLLVCFALASVLLAASANADIIKGPYTFDDDAFIDDVLAVGGLVTGAPDVVTAITDTDLGTWVNIRTAATSGGFIALGFSDNLAVNGPGPDIVIFERSAPTGYGVQIGAVLAGLNFGMLIGEVDGQPQNALELDLSDFGFADGELVGSLTLLKTAAGTPQITGVAALNSVSVVPEPTTALLFVAGLGLVQVMRRRD